MRSGQRANICYANWIVSPTLSSFRAVSVLVRLVIAESEAGICVPWEERAFVEVIVRLLKNPLLVHEMGVKGRRYVEEKRDYRRIADLVEEQYLHIRDEA